MSRFALLFVLVLPVVVTPCPAQSVASLSAVRGELAFDGHGTLGDFTGRTTTIAGTLTGAATLTGVRGWVTAEVSTLTTDNGRRDRDMRSSLEAERFPLIRFDLDAVAVGQTEGDSTAVTVRGRFTIHGVTRESAVRGWIRMEGAGVVFRGWAPMLLTDYRIGGLSKAFGLLKMNPDIVVRMDLRFHSPSAP